MKAYLNILCTALILSTACKQNIYIEREILSGNNYASRFSIVNEGNFKILEIIDPWQKANDYRLKYVLGTDPSELPDTLKSLPFIKTPVGSVVIFSTTHAGFLSALGSGNIIKGVSGSRYICDTIIRKGIEDGGVSEVGYAPAIDYEEIIRIGPDVVFLYGLESSVSGMISRLATAGIPAVPIAEFLEPHPLGKMEWIKVFGAFTGKWEIASGISGQVCTAYETYREKVLDKTIKPGVLVGLPWKESWNIAGGQSFTAKFIQDAGGQYLWSDDHSTEYLPLSLEAVYMKAYEAAYWINPGAANHKTDILAVDSRLGTIRAFREDLVFNNNARMGRAGGNDFWESGTVRPDLVLKDLILIFHPEEFPQDTFTYYRKLE